MENMFCSSAAIRPTDGEFVDVYHAASGTSSTPVKSGHVDFYIDECGVRICTCPVVQNLISPLNMTIDVIGQGKPLLIDIEEDGNIVKSD